MNRYLLFSKREPRQVASERDERIKKTIASIDAQSLTDEEIDQLASQFELQRQLVLARFRHPDGELIGYGAGNVKVQEIDTLHPQLQYRMRVEGYVQRVYIDFEGDPDSLNWVPNLWGPSKPRVEDIRGNQVVYTFATPNAPLPGEELRRKTIDVVQSIEEWLRYLEGEVRQTSPLDPREALRRRRDQFRRAQTDASDEGFYRVND